MYNYCLIPILFTVIASIIKFINFIFQMIFYLIYITFVGLVWFFMNIDKIFDLKKA